MRRARDEATGATLWHTTDGGPLHVPSSSAGRYYFCLACDREGRDPYVSMSGREVGFRPRSTRPHPDAKPAEAPDTSRSANWQPNTCKVRLTDGTVAECFTYEAQFSGNRQPRPRFQHDGRWWSVPIEAVF